ncbi:T9SS type A sorting domain-containing protein [Corallibacter sp.]|uniref:leucine-rich repeat domain-containing protein n=1 Tax=Corallibacter sp. TaxID=2038084 RepID=UPI003AB2D5DD
MKFVLSQQVIKVQNVLALFVFCMLYTHAFSQSTAIADSNFEQALVYMNIDTNGMTGDILNCDAENVLSLNLYNKDISDLTGIEAFVDLKTLNADYNNLTNINLSQNRDLEYIDVDNNALTTIDVSSNLDLHELHVSSNYLSSIDVSHNSELKSLTCSINNISTIDVSHNSELEVLWCYSNNLNTLTVSNNASLSSLICGQNNLSVLNITNNSNLKTISCASTGISELNIVNNPELEYLDCSNNSISNLNLNTNTQLKRVLASNNNLTAIDVSNLEDLFLFYIANNNLEHIDLSNNTDLRYFNAENNNLQEVDIRNNNGNRIREFNTTQNPSLTCLMVNDASQSYLNTWEIDAHTSFVNNENECQLLSTDSVSQLDTLSVYPNPASEFLYVTLNTNNESSLELFTISGQRIKKQTLHAGKNQIDISQINAGIYLTKIVSNGFSHSSKLIIK